MPDWIRLLVLLFLGTLGSTQGGIPAGAQEFSTGKAMLGSSPAKVLPATSILLDDATLRAVQFVDADHGWAVGDQGVILATTDGGRNWIPQRSGTQASLRQLHFTSLANGVIVGVMYQEDTGLSRGVILETHDGGDSWTPLAHDLPGLAHVRRHADGNLVVAGDWSTKGLGRIFQWSMASRDWQVIDSGDALQSDCVAGLDTVPVWVDRQGVFFKAGETPDRAVALSARPGTARIWGSEGIVVASTVDHPMAISRDGGSNWSEFQLPTTDAKDVTIRGNIPILEPSAVVVSTQGTVWIAGTPGDKVYRVDRDGRVSAGSTGQKAPLYGLAFLDEYRGWAVGAFGTILATRDGGQTWRPQRNEDRRAMVLAIAKSARNLPWSAIAVESLEYGRRCVVAVEDGFKELASQPFASFDPLSTGTLTKSAAAAAMVGSGETLGWNSQEPLLDRLLAAMRACEPSVLVIGRDIQGPLLDRIITLAVENGVKRVFLGVSPGDRADLVFFSSAVLPVAGHITGDLWEEALGIVAPQTPIEDRLSLRLVWDAHANDARLASLGEGLQVRGAERASEKGRRRNLQVLQARSNENIIIDRLFEQSVQHDLNQAKESLGILLKQTPAESRQRFLRTVIDRANRHSGKTTGEIVLYLAALELASEQFASEGLGLWAAFRLQAIRHSTEWQQSLLNTLPMPVIEDPSGAAPVAANRSPFERDENPSMNSDAVFRRSYESSDSPALPVSSEFQELRPVRSVSTFQEIDQQMAVSVASTATASLPGDSLWLNHPSILFWRASDGVERLELWDKEAFRKLGLSYSAGIWRSLGNHHLAENHVARAISLRGPVERPVLDGVLDELCWERVSADREQVSVTPQETEKQVDAHLDAHLDLRVAYDSDFVYFGIRAVFDDQDSEDAASNRKRDEDLKGHARVCIEVDIDRDLQTRYRLTVDRQGRTQDSCDGFLHWQPRWYVATALKGPVRTVEIAVHREDLVKLPLVSGDRWRVRASLLATQDPEPIATDLSPLGWIEVQME